MKKITFNKILSTWFISAIILCLLNSFTLQSSLFHNIVFGSLGLSLLVFPVYPVILERKYTPQKCRIIIRIIAVLQIILSFLVQTNF